MPQLCLLSAAPADVNIFASCGHLIFQLLASLANLFTALFKQVKWNWARAAADVKRNLDSLFAFSFMWSIGGSITDEGEGYAKMDAFIRAQKAFSQVPMPCLVFSSRWLRMYRQGDV